MIDSSRHAEGSLSGAIPSTNPLSSSLNIVVSIPDSIEIKMVDASILADYEIWFFISSILSSALIGFIVAFIQGRDASAPSTTAVGFMAVLIFILFFASVFMALYKRNYLKKKGRSIQLKATHEVASRDSA